MTTTQLNDKTGTKVTVRLYEGRPVSSYTVHLPDGTLGGRADFIDVPGGDGERIFFHTEIARELTGRGLAGLLVREALADTNLENLTVVPVCPLFAAHLRDHGDDFVAHGGRFRQPTPTDIALVRGATQRSA